MCKFWRYEDFTSVLSPLFTTPSQLVAECTHILEEIAGFKWSQHFFSSETLEPTHNNTRYQRTVKMLRKYETFYFSVILLHPLLLFLKWFYRHFYKPVKYLFFLRTISNFRPMHRKGKIIIIVRREYTNLSIYLSIYLSGLVTAVAVFRNPSTIPFCLTTDLLLNVLFSWLLVHLPSTFFLDVLFFFFPLVSTP